LAHTAFEELYPLGRNLNLEIEHAPPVWGDSVMIRQVFVNLLSNAIKFSHAKEVPRIKIGRDVAGRSDLLRTG
jgi:signal transduction histidine kinase